MSTHWSKPAALRVLEALRGFGGRATSLELTLRTRSVAVHSDIHSLRCWLREECDGFSGEDVETLTPNMSDGRRVYTYRLSKRLMMSDVGRERVSSGA